MKRTSQKVGLALAAAAATLLASGCASLCPGEQASVKCAGVNACKGSSSCATPDNSCKGHNKCQTQGWSWMSKSECMAKGGTVME